MGFWTGAGLGLRCCAKRASLAGLRAFHPTGRPDPCRWSAATMSVQPASAVPSGRSRWRKLLTPAQLRWTGQRDYCKLASRAIRGCGWSTVAVPDSDRESDSSAVNNVQTASKPSRCGPPIPLGRRRGPRSPAKRARGPRSCGASEAIPGNAGSNRSNCPCNGATAPTLPNLPFAVPVMMPQRSLLEACSWTLLKRKDRPPSFGQAGRSPPTSSLERTSASTELNYERSTRFRSDAHILVSGKSVSRRWRGTA